jgi:hypothetical protein
MSRIFVAVLGITALLGVSLAASHAQDLEAIRARQKAALEKLSGEVNAAVEKAPKMPASDAKFLLETLVRQVKDTDMLDTQRTALLAKLNSRLKQVNEADRGARIEPSGPERKFKYPPVEQPSGRPADVAKGAIDSAKNAQKNASDNIRLRNEGVLAVNRDIERVLPMDKEISFPKNWKEISERRRDMVNPKLTEKEAKLLKTLNSTISVKYTNEDKFSRVIDSLQDRTGLTIIVDKGSLNDLNLDYDDVVTPIELNKVAVRTVLKKVLGDKGLTYIIKEGSIQVMTPKRAAEYTVVRSYPIGDLITPVQANLMFPPFMQLVQKRQNAQQVINLIVFSTGQDYWQPNGPGSIFYFEASDALVIRASAEMHYQLASPGLFGR